MQRMVHKLARNAGITSNPSPHWLRHAGASHSIERGAPVHLVQKDLGHESLGTTGKYLHARPDDGFGRYLIL
jgi:integrase/recombinase XerD